MKILSKNKQIFFSFIEEGKERKKEKKTVGGWGETETKKKKDDEQDNNTGKGHCVLNQKQLPHFSPQKKADARPIFGTNFEANERPLIFLFFVFWAKYFSKFMFKKMLVCS